MKFSQFREAMKKGMPSGDHVFDKKIKGVEVMIHKEKNKFVLYIDRDKLDEFPNLNMAKKAGMEFVKQAGK